MGQRSGIGVVELAILGALDSLGAWPDQPYASNARVLEAVDQGIGLAPGYAYEVLLDLARQWRLPVPMVDGEGNYGAPTEEPHSEFRYTGARLSAAGAVAIAAESRELAPVPIGLINGNTHRDGRRPPFRPAAIIEAMRQVIRDPEVTSDDLVNLIGPPAFPAGCTVTGDLAALMAGLPATLELHSRLAIKDVATVAADRPGQPRLQAHAATRADQPVIVAKNIPPNADHADLLQRLADRSDKTQRRRRTGRTGLPLAEIVDISTETEVQLVFFPEPGTPPELLRDQLTTFDGITTKMSALLPQPLPDTIREWTQLCPHEDRLASLTGLEEAISIQRHT